MFSSAGGTVEGRGADRRRRSIVDAARRLSFAGGVTAVTARRLAAEVGCSPGALYLHFPSIEHVLHELRMEGHGLLTQYLRIPPPALHGVERICRMQREYHRFGRENPNHFRLMFLTPVDAGVLGELVGAEGASLDVVRATAARARDRGEIAAALDPLVVANVTWMSIHGVTSMIVSGHAAVTAPGREDELVDAVVAGTRAWLGAPRGRST